MAISNRDRIDKALGVMRTALAPFVEREIRHRFKGKALEQAQSLMQSSRLNTSKPIAEWDANALLQLMWDGWNEVFRDVLGRAERTLVREILDARHAWAHQQAFTGDETYRVLDSIGRLLTAIAAPEAAEVETSKMEVLRARYDEHVKKEKKRTAVGAIESSVTGNLTPWRDVISPHPDVAGGRYQQAEFAADLWQVHIGEGDDAYRVPSEFFRRTYLTESLHRLLVSSTERLSGKGGDPVVQLQTNFGGGKTHSMLALYHLFSGADTKDLVGIDGVLKAARADRAPAARRAVLVGNKISPGNPAAKSDGTVVRTLWGELAWQLGDAAGGVAEAAKAYARIAQDDEKATNPGDRLREIFNTYAPCVILIDEWVAYARQLHEENELPGGNFETQFSFAQALTESAKAADRCLLVVSLPASDTSGSPHAQADDAEVGGQRGHAALARLRNVIGRVESSWRPASAEEGFEIVRRRLFEPLRDQAQFVARDTVARSFHELYLGQHQEFPAEVRDSDYEKRLQAAYPIHPEVFDRLYTDWSTLLKFQRTRGVLRLMAAVIHSLWEKGDRNPLIMPGNIPIDDPRVQSELTRYLSDNWVPVIEKDVDGPSSLPLRIDAENPNLGRFHATRRVARAIYLGSAPTVGAAHQGIEDRRIKLGCVIPGESPAVFGDALRRLAAQATYLYPDGTRYWYATQPTVAKVAEDYAERLLREKDKVVVEIERRLRTNLKNPGDFSKIHPLPGSGHDVPDEREARLVVIGTEHPHAKGKDSPARSFAQAILESRGSGPRIFRNTLTFLALDQQQLQNLDEAVRKYLAWCMILDEQERHNLSAHQVKLAENQRKNADATVDARIPEAYVWLLVPTQREAASPITWEEHRLSGSDHLAVRASKKLVHDEALITRYAGARLRLDLDRLDFLWRGDHVQTKQLEEDFAKYLYLPRLRDSQVLRNAVSDGVGLLSWRQDGFAYADDFDEKERRYRGLRGGRVITVSDQSGLLVKANVAQQQLAVEEGPAAVQSSPGNSAASGVSTPESVPVADSPATLSKMFRASVELDPARVGRDASAIAEEVIAHLNGIVDARVTVTLEIETELPSGASDALVRTVTENCRTLKFKRHGFE